MGRVGTVARTTKETNVTVELALDGTGATEIATGLPFFDHMLQQLGKHASWDLSVTCTGDLEVDGHHTVEDVGLALGQALAEALGDKAGIRRFASIVVPLDEAAVEVALDLVRPELRHPRGGRPGRDDRHVRHRPRRGLRACVGAGRRPHRARPASIRPFAASRGGGGVQGAGEGPR